MPAEAPLVRQILDEQIAECSPFPGPIKNLDRLEQATKSWQRNRKQAETAPEYEKNAWTRRIRI
jgi:hypothetical protein